MIFGTHDEKTIQQLQNCVDAEPSAIGVLCADGHLGYSMPIGGVVAYRDHMSPSGVGYDIACGNMAAKTNIRADELTRLDLTRIADEIAKRVSFGIGRSNAEPVDDPVIEAIAQSPVIEQRALAKLAEDQLGTVGSGNHYVDVFVDQDGWIWIGVHFGSRGFGHKTATMFMNVANGLPMDARSHDGEMMSPPLLLPLAQPSGQDYIAAMTLAGEYAYAGRRQVVGRVLDILGATAVDTVHNHHNFAWQETHGGESYWVVRKGATPAFPGQRGFVGGSMGDISVILHGVESETSASALYSTVHGAGRVMSRTQAAGKQKWIRGGWKCGNRACELFNMATPLPFDSVKQVGNERPICYKCGGKWMKVARRSERKSTGLVDFDAVQARLTAAGLLLRGAGADEAPEVYRSLRDVLAAHADTIAIETTLTPLIVVMAGADVYDPFKD